MAAIQSIGPFPAEIDRCRFGDWLSGFAAGEACFSLRLGTTRRKKRHRRQPSSSDAYFCPRAAFQIALRRDDQAVLELIQKFWQCGRLTYFDREKQRSKGSTTQDTVEFRVAGMGDLHRVVVPHFERHPLWAKKARDFSLWKEAVALMAQAFGRRQAPGRPKWRSYDRDRFAVIVVALKAVRVYDSQSVPSPAPLPPSRQPGLFDDPPA